MNNLLNFISHMQFFFRPQYLPAAMLFFFFTASFSPQQLYAQPKAADLVEDGQPIDLNQEKYSKLFHELKTEHQFSQDELDAIFTGQNINKKILELMDRQWEAKPYYQYSPLFLTEKNIAQGREKLVQYKDVLDRVEQEIGVDREIVVAIWGIETRYGANQGSYYVLQTLNTLFDAYPRRSAFFRGQLIHFLLLCKENGVDPKTVKGSYAGAFGQTQFIPSSFRSYAVSFDGDTIRDVWDSVPDVLASIANYLKQHYWALGGPIYAELGSDLKDKRLIAAYLQGRKGKVDWELVRNIQNPDIPPSPGDRKLSIVGIELSPDQGEKMRYVAGYPNFQAITEWNHSNRYAMAVTELSEAIRLE
ncbi:MAG: lytic murein transglycosylase [Desulfobulbaceae bacterium]|nr:lytic murein transglycosylase [Desulfobulbaceae bacterium]